MSKLKLPVSGEAASFIQLHCPESSAPMVEHVARGEDIHSPSNNELLHPSETSHVRRSCVAFIVFTV